MVEKVIPPSLNYSDLKPEVIENEVRLIRFVPTATINGARPNDVIKFLLQGNGFFDPYSAYLKFTVVCNDLLAGELRTLDRSAHSFINRFVVRSQGVELERIEQYDVIAAQINSMLYSPEQKLIHGVEGFPQQTIDTSVLQGLLMESTPDAANARYGVANIPGDYATAVTSNILSNSTQPAQNCVGEVAFYNAIADGSGASIKYAANGTPLAALDAQGNALYIASQGTAGSVQFPGGAAFAGAAGAAGAVENVDFTRRKFISQGVVNGVAQSLGTANLANAAIGSNISGSVQYTFCIPLYSGILGVLMPDKKLLPLSLLPLELELTLNPHALYTNLANGSRNYQISKIELFSHVMFFEQEVHRSLEAVVAEHGIFLHFQSFYLAPVTQMSGPSTPGYAQLLTPFKSINSIHSVFIYETFQTLPWLRKLAFNSHNITKMQVRNGTFLLPSEPIEGQAGTTTNGDANQFIVETYKGWNKMHDPNTDGDLVIGRWGIDNAYQTLKNAAVLTAQTGLERINSTAVLIYNQASYGRTMYAVSFEGEELGTNKSLITGKKAQMPFDIILQGTRNFAAISSWMFTHLRCDFIVYVRPDLVVSILGR